MPSHRSRLQSAACLLLLACGSAFASPSFRKRQDDGGAGNSTITVGNSTTAPLEPVVPPAVDTKSPAVLKPKTAVQLYFQSSATSQKRDNQAVAAQVLFNFRYPAVPLDHSDLIAGIVCTDTTVKATFNDSTGFQQAQSSWPTKSTFLLITNTAGCGSDDSQNGYFVATTAAFDSGSSSVTAQGTFQRLNQTYADVTITWGQANTTDSTEASHRLKPRCDDDFCGSASFDFNLSPEIAAELAKGSSQSDAETAAKEEDDHEAPWENAYLLWSSSNGDDDTTPSGKRKRGLVSTINERGLEERKVEKGFNLYCVDCGIQGSFTIGGAMSYCILCFSPGVTNAQLFLSGNMEAGVYLGLEAFAEYTKDWQKELILVNLLGWQIGDLISVGPYVELDIKASFGIKAEGTLLMGGGASWPNFGATLDLLNDANSQPYGFQPDLQQKFEAKGELSIETSLGLPLSIGVGIDVDSGWWKAGISVVDTPELKAEASISISYINDNKYSTVSGQTIADDNNGLDLNDDCYGVKYEISFENNVDFIAQVDDIGSWDYNLYKWDYTFLEGCLGYQKPACEDAVRASPIIGDGVMCNVAVDSIDTGSQDLTEGDTQTVESEEFCAGLCMADKNCKSFTWGSDATECQLYNTDVATLSGLSAAGSSIAMFDKNCYQTKDCPYNATDPDPPSSRKHRRMGGMYDARSGVYHLPS